MFGGHHRVPKKKKKGQKQKSPKIPENTIYCTQLHLFGGRGRSAHFSEISARSLKMRWSRLNLLLSAPDNWPLQGISGVLVGSLGLNMVDSDFQLCSRCVRMTHRAPLRSSSTLWGQVMAATVPVFSPQGDTFNPCREMRHLETSSGNLWVDYLE